MPILFGWGRTTRHDHGRAFPMDCPKCHNRTFYRYLNIKVWFTLFFLPVIPYKSRHLFVCEVCSRALEFNGRAEIERAKRMVEATTQFGQSKLTEDQYRAALTSGVPIAS